MTEPLNHRQLREAIEAEIKKLPWNLRAFFTNDDDYTVIAGVVRKALAGQLAEHAETRATLERVRALARRHRGEPTIPRRQIEAALAGDEDHFHAR